MPSAATLLLYAGAAYLLWLGVRTLRRSHGRAGAPGPAASRARLFRDGVMVDLLNPKTALFFLAFLPGFVHAGAGPVALQVVLLGVVFVALATLTDAAYALAAARMSGGVRRGRGIAYGSAAAYG